MIAISIAVIATVIVCCRRRKKEQNKLKTFPLQCSNQLSDINLYSTHTPVVKEADILCSKPKEKETAIKVDVPLPHLARHELSRSVSSTNSEPQSEGEDVVEKAVRVGIPLPELVLNPPKMKQNVSYGYVDIPSSEYAVPQHLSQQQRARHPLLPSERQSVEAYAITNLT